MMMMMSARGDLNPPLNKSGSGVPLERGEGGAGRRGALEAHAGAVSQGRNSVGSVTVKRPAKPSRARCFSCMPFLAPATRPGAPAPAGSGTVTGNASPGVPGALQALETGAVHRLHAVTLQQRISELHASVAVDCTPII